MNPQREWFEKDYYAVLGVSKDASQKDINSAYRKLARELHPDANPGDDAAEERFKEVSAAYDVLGDETKREEYDKVRAMGAAGAGFGGAGGPGGFDLGDLGDLGGIFDLFGRAGGGRRPQATKGANLEADLHLSFEDAAKGVTTTVHLTSDAVCRNCDGSGAEPGTSPSRCPECGGAGAVNDNQGLFSFSRPCVRCAGAGTIIDHPCASCRGTGVERRPRKVKVRIPPVVDPDKLIRVKGHGAPGANGGPAGDLIVRVRVGSHPYFTRKGRNLKVTVPVSITEATLGTDLVVPTLDGETVTVRLPAGTPAGRTLRVAGAGVETPDGTGDLLVTIEVVVPGELTDDQRSALERLDEVLESPNRAFLGV